MKGKKTNPLMWEVGYSQSLIPVILPFPDEAKGIPLPPTEPEKEEVYAVLAGEVGKKIREEQTSSLD